LGQKANPILLRLQINQQWRSRWFARKKDFGILLAEDNAIRQYVKKQLENAGIADIVIERYANRVRINIYTARPGIVIGRRGADVERIRTELSERTGKEVYLEIHEVKDPEANAQLVAENIALQLSRRISHKRAMKQAIALAMAHKNVEGIKIRVGGRIGGAELARAEWYKEGKIPLHTFSANIEYGFAEAATKAGRIGVKVWICKKKEDEQKTGDK
jgi:small subunit ribosomal protein S3